MRTVIFASPLHWSTHATTWRKRRNWTIWVGLLVIWLLVVMIVLGRFGFVVDETITVIGFMLVVWAYDTLMGWTARPVLQAPTTLSPSNAIAFWHVSTTDARDFSAGIDLDKATVLFLGRGFYVWRSLEAAQRYAILPPRYPKTLVRITISAQAWQHLRVVSLRGKYSWAYVRLLILFGLRPFVRSDSQKEKFAAYVSQPWSSSDAVEAPALGLAAVYRQIVFRHTPGSVALLANATVECWPIVPDHPTARTGSTS